MLLDKTSCDLLLYLIRSKEPKTVMAISREIGQSRRKIYYHLDKINDALDDEKEKIMSQPRIGILLTESQKKLCQTLLNSIDSYTYIMNSAERMNLMIVYICTANQRVTIDKLIELTEVSRNTVLNDLNNIRYQLTMEQYQMHLCSTKADGYYFDCHPLNKIQYIHSLLYRIFHEGNEGFIVILTKKLKEILAEEVFLSERLQHFLSQQVPLVEQDLGKKINRYEIEFMLNVLPYLLLSCINLKLDSIEKKAFEQEFSLIRKRIEYTVAKHLVQRLQKSLEVHLSEIEISLIAVLFLSYRKDKDVHATSQDFIQLKEDLDEFLWRFEASSSYEIENKEDLIRNLLIHCKALLFRKTYGILTKNPLTQKIKSKYSDLFNLTKKCSIILEEAWLVILTDDEIAYLTIHIGGALKNSQSEKRDAKHIYLVCDEGVSVSKLLLKQCGYYLPSEHLEAVFTTEQFKSVEDILEADLLITTNDGLETNFPMIQVQPILSDEDILKLTYFVKHNHKQEKSQFEQELSRILSHYVKESDKLQELKQQIQMLIRDELIEL